jgi:hypothetical protein
LKGKKILKPNNIFKVILENIFIPILGNVNFIKYFVNISLANMLA